MLLGKPTLLFVRIEEFTQIGRQMCHDDEERVTLFLWKNNFFDLGGENVAFHLRKLIHYF